jgi:hypothetical protein
VDYRDTTWALSGNRLARLLKIGMEPAGSGEGGAMEPRPEDLLAGLLSKEVSLNAEVGYSLSAVLGRSCSEMRPCVGRALGEVLTDPETDVVALRTLKDYGKRLVSASGSKAEQAAATAVYYAAIVAALVFHGRRITRYSYRQLDENLARLEGKAWLPLELNALFRKAREICRQRIEETPQQKGD